MFVFLFRMFRSLHCVFCVLYCLVYCVFPCIQLFSICVAVFPILPSPVESELPLINIIYCIISYPIHNLVVQEVVQVGGGYFSYYQTALRHKPQDHNINYFRIRSNPDPRFQNASVQVCETLGPRPS